MEFAWVGLTAVLLRLLLVFIAALQIVLRKGYHLIAAVLFIPVFFLDLEMLCVSLAIAFAALVAVEAMRCLKVPVVGQAVQQFMQVTGDHGLFGEVMQCSKHACVWAAVC